MSLSEDVLYSTVGQLSERIRSRALSPVALTEAYLERSRRVGGRLNAYATLMPERALAEARAAEALIMARGPSGPLPRQVSMPIRLNLLPLRIPTSAREQRLRPR